MVSAKYKRLHFKTLLIQFLFIDRMSFIIDTLRVNEDVLLILIIYSYAVFLFLSLKNIAIASKRDQYFAFICLKATPEKLQKTKHTIKDHLQNLHNL